MKNFAPQKTMLRNQEHKPQSGRKYFLVTYLFMGLSRQEYWSGLPYPSPVDHILSDLSTMTHLSWLAPQGWLSFIELDKAVVLVWLDWLVFCDYGFSVSALWCPLATPTFLLEFSLLGHVVSLHGCSSKAQLLLLTLDEGYLLTAALTAKIPNSTWEEWGKASHLSNLMNESQVWGR